MLSKLDLCRTCFFWAGLHFLASLALAGFCIYIALGAALSDAYRPYPAMLQIAETMLFILQFPAGIVYWLLARGGATATWNLGIGLGLAAVWSASLGFILRRIGRAVEKSLRSLPS